MIKVGLANGIAQLSQDVFLIQLIAGIGVRRQDGEFLAHAWVEREGAVLNDRSDVRLHYAAFDRAMANWA